MIAVLLLCLLFPAQALALSSDDFAGGYTLEVQPGFALQRLELPWEVYNASTRADLGDMRVFNAAGDETPSLLRRSVERSAASVNLPLFRLHSSGNAEDFDFRLYVRTSKAGAVVETRVQPAGDGERLLLLDATGAPDGLGALRFELNGEVGPLRARVRGSDDLAAWHQAGAGVLARLEHPNGRIVQDRLALSGRVWKYYLVSGGRGLSSVQAVSGEPRNGRAPRRFAPLQGVMVEPGVWDYRLPPGLPADFLDMGQADNAVLGVKVMVPADDAWRSIASGTLFRLSVEDQRISGPGLTLRGLLPRFRIVMQGAPVPLRVGWHPHELVFMVQGPGPFTLALGNPSVAPGPSPLESMLAQEKAGGMPMGGASLGDWRVLGGEERLRPVRTYTKLVLWAVLGLGVALLGWMAWRLARNLDA